MKLKIGQKSNKYVFEGNFPFYVLYSCFEPNQRIVKDASSILFRFGFFLSLKRAQSNTFHWMQSKSRYKRAYIIYRRIDKSRVIEALFRKTNATTKCTSDLSSVVNRIFHWLRFLQINSISANSILKRWV